MLKTFKCILYNSDQRLKQNFFLLYDKTPEPTDL